MNQEHKPTSQLIDSRFRAVFMQVLVIVLTILCVVFGVLATNWMLGFILIGCHAVISALLAKAIYQGEQKRKDFAIACVVPNLCGYVFAIGGLLGIDRWLFISLSIFAVLGILGLARRLLSARWGEHQKSLARIPLFGKFFGGGETVKDKPSTVDQGSLEPEHQFEVDELFEAEERQVQK